MRKGFALISALLLAGCVNAFPEEPKKEELVQIKSEMPEPFPRWVHNSHARLPPNMEPLRVVTNRPPILVPKGCDQLISRGCKVTSSDPDPVIGELSYVTDGDKEYDPASYVELAPGVQWVQIDLGEPKEIHAVWIWRNAWGQLVYNDIIVQISDDPNFTEGIVTIFNNDHDNSAGLGVGKDFSYFEQQEGRLIPANGVKGRYVRCYSNGSNWSERNFYTEVEVFGRKE